MKFTSYCCCKIVFLEPSLLNPDHKRKKTQVTDWEKTFVKHKSDKGLVSKVYQELLKLKYKKSTQFKNGKRSDHTKVIEDILMANKHMKGCSVSYVIKELLIKTTMSY